MKKIKLLFLPIIILANVTLIYTGNAHAATVEDACLNAGELDYSHIIPCYREKLAAEPLSYWFMSNQLYGDVEVNRYQMISQMWSPDDLVSPVKWQEDVAIAIPDNQKGTRALIAVDISEDILIKVARATNTVVISLHSIPSRDLVYANDNKPLIEDDSIARSWRLTMEDPATRQTLPLHVPMAASISQTIRLAKKELAKENIDKFIVTGASKRGWATWLSAIADPNVEAIVPIVADVLNTQEVMEHMYKSYGGNWPIAFEPYYQQGIDKTAATADFANLMKVEDPIQYLGTAYQSRLAIPKYIINASGDDFFMPDNTRFYYDKLPGEKSLRVAPNTGHIGILAFTQQSLITFLNRIQNNVALPEIDSKLEQVGNGQQLDVKFSETPAKVVRWTAVNPVSRDFRFACGIQYVPTTLTMTSPNSLTIPMNFASPGWEASFVEATFKDGYVATTQVNIFPDNKYPTAAPPSKGGACTTLPGRGIDQPSIAKHVISNSEQVAVNR
ncbi:PhoPQ-activated protein PqaA family protein [Rouxiella sp. T17]|uniref:PhoPQ-activated protein PqaA family protein n=1 Tax=Rouxiella sp. T17 TaxID=3085684 RepID=UPI002FC85096